MGRIRRRVLKLRFGRARWVPWLAACAFAVCALAVAPGARASDDATETAPSRAAVVLVGDVEKSDELVALLGELLDRQGVQCEFSEAARFEPDALFAEENPGDVRVFIRLSDARRARLYFRGPSGEKFLLRTIALPNGFDEVGRELVGQVVESSVVALLRSSTGLSREQASAEVAREEELAKPPPSERPSPPPERHEPTERRSLSLSAALRYAAESFGPDFSLAHGPGVELGVRSRGALRLGGRVSGEWFFEQTLDAEELTASVQAIPLRIAFEASFRAAEAHSIGVAIGGGFDIVRVEPGSSHVEGVTPSAPETNFVPILRPELRYELGIGSFALGAAVFADISLVRTHYDLAENGELTRLGTPWRARPGGALLIGMVY